MVVGVEGRAEEVCWWEVFWSCQKCWVRSDSFWLWARRNVGVVRHSSGSMMGHLCWSHQTVMENQVSRRNCAEDEWSVEHSAVVLHDLNVLHGLAFL